jgi:hypothetical protein
VTVDLFSNHVHFTPINANFSGDNLVEYLVTRFFPLHGFPQVFVGDQGPQLTSALFTHDQVLKQEGESIESYTIDANSGFLYYKNRLCVSSSLYQQICNKVGSPHIGLHVVR